MTRRELRSYCERALALGLLWLGIGCSPAPVAQDGSETHFLRGCEAGCEAPASCVCGVCTTECSSDAACSRHGEAASCVPMAPRIAEGRCEDVVATNTCDAECLADADCAWLGSGFACQSGYCRRGEPSSPGAGSGTCAPSGIQPGEVAILGDALIELSPFTADLEQRALDAGWLPAGAHYRDYAAGLMSLFAEGSLSLAGQYEAARSEGAMRVIVMNGGATDVLNDPCDPEPSAACPAVRAAASGAEALFAGFRADGVEHVVYFFYPDAVDNPPLRAGIDTLRPLLQNVCGKSRVACHWLDLRPAFSGHPSYITGDDGIIFSATGADAAASAVFELMSARCVGH